MKVAVIYSDADDLSSIPQEELNIHDRDACTRSVNEALKSLDHEVVPLAAKDGLLKTLRRLKGEIGLAFNLADCGYECNTQLEPHIPAMLDVLGIPYTGSDYICLANCLDKVRTKQLLIGNGLPTPEFAFFGRRITRKTYTSDLRFPLIVKPSREDGSAGLQADSIVEDSASMIKKVNELISKYSQPALVEEFIDGREITVGILGRKVLTFLPMREIAFSQSLRWKFLPSEAKWERTSPYYTGTASKCPAELEAGLEKTLRDMAEKAYRLMGVKDYGRVDFRISADGNPYILEVNPNPDLSEDAGLALMAKAAGMTYPELIGQILKSALNKD